MITYSTFARPKAKMSPREILATKLKEIVYKDKQSVEKIDENSWKIPGVEVESKTNDYIVRLEAKIGKSGKTFKKRNLYRVVDGVEQKVELGNLKKEYLYKIIANLVSNKAPRTVLKKYNADDVYAMSEYIKEHKDDFKNENGVITGRVPQGEFRYVLGSYKEMKNNHRRLFGRQLYINGELHSEGGGLVVLDRAFAAKKRGRKKSK